MLEPIKLWGGPEMWGAWRKTIPTKTVRRVHFPKWKTKATSAQGSPCKQVLKKQRHSRTAWKTQSLPRGPATPRVHLKLSAAAIREWLARQIGPHHILRAAPASALEEPALKTINAETHASDMEFL